MWGQDTHAERLYHSTALSILEVTAALVETRPRRGVEERRSRRLGLELRRRSVNQLGDSGSVRNVTYKLT